MKKFTFSALLLTLTTSLNAQTPVLDSVVMGASYANEVYYILEDGTKSEQAFENWHLGFSTDLFSATISTNPKTTSTAIWPGGTNTDFETVDSVGFSTWPKLFNDSVSWSIGALNQNATGGMDYGWGAYNLSTHIVQGDSVYIVKVGNVTYKVDIVKKQSGTITLRYADIADATAGTEIEIPASTYGTKDFVYFNLTDGEIKDRELEGWDLWAVQYSDWYNGSAANQTVTGILTNPKWEVAIINAGAGNQSSHVDFSSGNFIEDKKNILGQGYKALNSSFQWVVTDSDVYYLRNSEGDVWKWYPTSFVGAGQGKTVFYKQKLATAGIETQISQFIDIYPNPAKDQLTVVFDSKASNAEIIVRNQMGQIVAFESLNTTTGVTQQKLDISALNNGVYFVEVNQNGFSTVKNVVKY